MAIPQELELAALLRDNELESAKLTARNWRHGAWGLGVLLAVSVLGNVYQGTQSHWMIRYVEVDKASMQSRVIEPAAERYEPSTDIVKKALKTAIKTLRSVSEDTQRMDDDWNALKVCTTKTGKERLREYETREAPRKPKYPRDIQITSLLRKTARSYDVRWTEWQYGQNKLVETTTPYSGSLLIERRDPKNDAELAHCPEGIFLDNFTLAKDQ